MLYILIKAFENLVYKKLIKLAKPHDGIQFEKLLAP